MSELENILIDDEIEDYYNLVLLQSVPRWADMIRAEIYIQKYNIPVRRPSFIDIWLETKPIIREENGEDNTHTDKIEDKAHAYPVPQNIKNIRRIF